MNTVNGKTKQEYLQSLPKWDGVKRIDTMLRDYLGADSLGAVDSLHSLPQDPSVQSVDSGAA